MEAQDRPEIIDWELRRQAEDLTGLYLQEAGSDVCGALCDYWRSKRLEQPSSPPHESLASQFIETLADNLAEVERRWIKSDKRMIEASWHIPPETHGFEELVRYEYRGSLAQLVESVSKWLFPLCGPFLDPALRDRILRILVNANLDRYLPSVDGETGARWRQTWPETGLDMECAQTIPALRSAADAAAIAIRKTVESCPAGSRVQHAPDFTWIRAANGTRYDFGTGRQRDIIRVLYGAWESGGDGARMSEAAILTELGERIERLRPQARFEGHPALGTILRRCEGAESAWALYLDDPGPRAK